MRRFFKIVIGLVALIVVAVGAAIVLIPRERVVALATDQVRAATGRELALTGDLSPSIWPVLGVRTGPVTLSNAEWGAADHLVSAGAAEIGIELMPLISGEVKVAALRLVDPVVSLEVNDQGLGNWVFDKQADSGAGGDSGAGRELPKIALPEAVIKNGTIRFTDARTGQRIELTELDLQAALSAIDAPLTLEGSGIWNGARASLDARIETPAAMIEERNTSVMLALASDPATLTFEGDVQAGPGDPIPLIDGALVVDVANPAKAVAWASGTAAPAGLSQIGAVKLDAKVSAGEDGLDVTAKG
ncbi:MAG: AsmA family protein, partial [Paracoccaceae bacterium]|nr:AsmA family protein [Paracoccaceae bacterium]